MPAVNKGFALVGEKFEIETLVQLINIGAGKQFSISKAQQRKARNCYQLVADKFCVAKPGQLIYDKHSIYSNINRSFGL